MFKLIRDNVPGIIQQSGEVCNYAKAVNDELYYALLREKLVEEVNEYLTSDSIEDLAGVYTVIKAMSGKYVSNSGDALMEAYESKKALKGEFKEGYIGFFPDKVTTSDNDKQG